MSSKKVKQASTIDIMQKAKKTIEEKLSCPIRTLVANAWYSLACSTTRNIEDKMYNYTAKVNFSTEVEHTVSMDSDGYLTVNLGKTWKETVFAKRIVPVISNWSNTTLILSARTPRTKLKREGFTIHSVQTLKVKRSQTFGRKLAKERTRFLVENELPSGAKLTVIANTIQQAIDRMEKEENERITEALGV